MLTDFEQKVFNYIKAEHLLKASDKVLLAVSGGADSTALLLALTNLKKASLLKNDFHIAHINHQLRDDAAEDENFVIEKARQFNIPFTIKKVDVREFAKDHKLSIETAARRLRLKSLSQIADQQNCTAIATAHHKDDNCETIIHRLIRGTGYRGLAGIWPKKIFEAGQIFIRPFLCAGRKDIESCLVSQNINWRTDHTNYDVSFTRNRIRHKLLPYLQKQTSAPLSQQLLKLAEISLHLQKKVSQQSDTALADIKIKSTQNQVAISAPKLLKLPPLVQNQIICDLLESIGSGLKDLDYDHFERIVDFAENAKHSKILQLPNGFYIRKDYDNLIFSKKKAQPSAPPESEELNIPGRTALENWQIRAEVFDADCFDLKDFIHRKTGKVECFDLDKIQLPLIARPRKIGDRFTPLNLSADKKIGKFLTAEKVGFDTRKNTFVITDSKKILWLCPVRISDNAKITAETRRILRLTVSQSR